MFIAKADSENVCPLSVTKKILPIILDNPNQPLVCRLTSNGKPQSKALTYTRVKVVMSQTLLSCDVNPKFYGTKCLKKGAINCLKNSKKVSDKAIDEHVGWACPRSKKSYLELDISKRLTVEAIL